MNRTNRQLAVMVSALVLLGASAAGAQTQPAPPAPSEVRAPESTSSASGAQGATHMRSSHTVDVIAPGEKVDTILGRMRPERPLPPTRADAVRPPPGSDFRGGGSQSGPGRTEQSRPLENGRDNGRDSGRDTGRSPPSSGSSGSSRGGGPGPSPTLPTPPR